MNDYINKEYETRVKNIHASSISSIRSLLPDESDKNISQVYKLCISLHQSTKSFNGKWLERMIAPLLIQNHIPFKEQVTIDRNGKVIGFNLKKLKCDHIVDFVIGTNIEVGNSIEDFKVISCKTTCRERWTQDNWSREFPPILYILLTISSDYPPSRRFIENEKRKIVSSKEKKKDDRIFKLNFNHLISELVV